VIENIRLYSDGTRTIGTALTDKVANSVQFAPRYVNVILLALYPFAQIVLASGSEIDIRGVINAHH
jgi:hypothetical protein